MTYRVGIDAGGTFTDIVAIDTESGAMLATKTPSTPNEPSRALETGLDKILGVLYSDRSAVATLIHGTTVATNALIEEKFDSLALVTTRGFRHILEIARQSVPSGYGNSYFWIKPNRIVPLERVYEVSERLTCRGEVLRPLVEEDAHSIGRALRKNRVEAVAISLIHAYANPTHEERVRDILLEESPSLVVSISSQVLPEYREYERTMTTCIDAYVKPVMGRYIKEAVNRLQFGNKETRTPLLIMQSNGGVLSASEVAKQPITTLLSGPAAGALGASYLAGIAGYERVMTVDAGGTSTDICLVEEGSPHVTTTGAVGRFPVKLPMVEVTTIGTGGGSIAWRDRSGGIRVGPQSAGAEPGPMCYRRGGRQPTLTDANVALGRLPARLLGGEIALDRDLAWEGLKLLGAEVGLAPERLAAGIVEIADWNQVNAIRQVTVKKGLDPREYTMVAFGGSGPQQAPHVAELLGMDTVLIPPDPGNVSAFGLLSVDLKTDYVTTAVQREDRTDALALNAAFSRLEERANRDLAAEGVAPERRRFVRTADLRYFGEAYEVPVETPEGEIGGEVIRDIVRRFHQAHLRLYGYSYENEQLCEIVNLRISALGLVERPRVLRREPEAVSDRPVVSTGRREVSLLGEGDESLVVLMRSSLCSSEVIHGPVVIEEYGSTTIVPMGWTCSVDSHSNLILKRGGSSNGN